MGHSPQTAHCEHQLQWDRAKEEEKEGAGKEKVKFSRRHNCSVRTWRGGGGLKLTALEPINFGFAFWKRQVIILFNFLVKQYLLFDELER